MGRRLGLEKLSGSVPVPEKSDVTELEVEQQVNKNINVHNDSAHCSQSNPNLYISSSANSTVRQTGGHRQTGPGTHDGWWGRTLLDAHGGDAVSLAVLLQAQLLFVQVHRGGIDSCTL